MQRAFRRKKMFLVRSEGFFDRPGRCLVCSTRVPPPSSDVTFFAVAWGGIGAKSFLHIVAAAH